MSKGKTTATGENTILVRAERRARRYDEERGCRGCYVYDISFKTSAPLTDRTIEVSKTFGLGVDEEKEHVLYRDFELRLTEGDVVYITGDSGSGKSVLIWEERPQTSTMSKSARIPPSSTPSGRASGKPWASSAA
jgi:ABC-type ATPase with predicted acetyltransferase domain